MTENPDNPTQPAAAPRPVIVDLGKVKRKRIKALKAGRGPLLDEVSETLEAVRQQLGAEAEGRELLPVVILYRPKRRKKGLFSL